MLLAHLVVLTDCHIGGFAQMGLGFVALTIEILRIFAENTVTVSVPFQPLV